MDKKLILWDWNGTLLDDIDLCVELLNDMLKNHGYPNRYDIEGYRRIFHFPIIDYYKDAGFDFSKHSFQKLAQCYIDRYEPESQGCSLMPGAMEALELVKSSGAEQTVLSASNKGLLISQIKDRGIFDFFQSILGLEDHYAATKVELGLNYMKGEHIDKQRACMIGDSVHDFEVAKALGVHCVLYAKGHQHRDFLDETGAPIAQSLVEAVRLALDIIG